MLFRSLTTAQIALERMEIDELGLDQSDRNMLAAIIKNYGGGPVGLETTAFPPIISAIW